MNTGTILRGSPWRIRKICWGDRVTTSNLVHYQKGSKGQKVTLSCDGCIDINALVNFQRQNLSFKTAKNKK